MNNSTRSERIQNMLTIFIFTFFGSFMTFVVAKGVAVLVSRWHATNLYEILLIVAMLIAFTDFAGFIIYYIYQDGDFFILKETKEAELPNGEIVIATVEKGPIVEECRWDKILNNFWFETVIVVPLAMFVTLILSLNAGLDLRSLLFLTIVPLAWASVLLGVRNYHWSMTLDALKWVFFVLVVQVAYLI